ncbi:unnamed protein product [Amoebophrya sp. A25]|nr:unnamed protein product [Amoebophrya sp. A25]|eukprot:GSA25T00000913001.1
MFAAAVGGATVAAATASRRSRSKEREGIHSMGDPYYDQKMINQQQQFNSDPAGRDQHHFQSGTMGEAANNYGNPPSGGAPPGAVEDTSLSSAENERRPRPPVSQASTITRRGKKNPAFYELRRDNCFTDIAMAQWFENTALFVIVLNALWIGVEVDLNSGDDSNKDVFIAVENIFCVLFTAEIVIRLLSYKKPLFFCTDKELRFWNIFDMVLVLLMVIENWILSWALEDEDGAMSSLSALRLLRLLRISRIFRMVPELGMMVKSMAAAARSVSSTMVLAVGLMYVFAVLFTQWGKNKEHFNGKCDPDLDPDDCDGVNYFGSLGWSFMSLMQILVYDDTFALIRKTYIANPLMGLLLILFILVGAFTVLNMLIGVICEIVSTTKAEEEEKLLMSKVEDLFAQMDADESGTISRDEFEAKTQLLEKLGLDHSTIRLAFELIDDDRSGTLEMQEFIHMVFRLLHPPAAQDLLVVKRNLAKLCDSLGCDVFDAPPPMKASKAAKAAAREREAQATREEGGKGGSNNFVKKSKTFSNVDGSVAQYSIEHVEGAIRSAVSTAVKEELANGGTPMAGSYSAPNALRTTLDSFDSCVGGPSEVDDMRRDLRKLGDTVGRVEMVLTSLRDKLQVKRRSSQPRPSALTDGTDPSRV